MRLLLIIVSMLAAMVLALMVIVVVGEQISNPLPPIARNLPQYTHEASAAFDARIKRSFPIGSPEKNLVDELLRQKFTTPQKDDRSDRSYATFTRFTNIIVTETFSVVWRTNPEGQLTEIKGAQGLTGW